MVVTGMTMFEDVLQATYHSLCHTKITQPHLTWRFSSNQKGGHATPLDNTEEWACALGHARKMMSHQHKASDVEIIIGFSEPQVLLFSFLQSFLTSMPPSMDTKTFGIPTSMTEGVVSVQSIFVYNLMYVVFTLTIG